MPGQATVTIDSNQWTVSVASTAAELLSGLGGIADIVAGTGMLFDLGYDQRYIEINMSEMLFNLDIVFINSSGAIVGVMHNVQAGEAATVFENSELPGARYFMEVNAGEAEGIGVGNVASIQGQIEQGTLQPAFWVGLMNVVMAVLVGISAYRELKGPPKEAPRGTRNER